MAICRILLNTGNQLLLNTGNFALLNKTGCTFGQTLSDKEYILYINKKTQTIRINNKNHNSFLNKKTHIGRLSN